MDKLNLASFAKLNLYLEVLGKRKDNYHDLFTVFEKISLADKIILKNRKDNKIRVSSSSKEMPVDLSNLCAKAALLLREKECPQKGVDIIIKKHIPVASGMGGGSSNAATTLLGLNRLWRLRLSRRKLAFYAAKIGADVPFFIYDSRFALGKGRGDRIKPLQALRGLRLWHIIVVPKITASTPFIYKKWDELIHSKQGKKVRLTLPKYNVNILTLALLKKDFSLFPEALFNSLEQITFGLYPELINVRESLKKAGLKAILMSGSGPTIFGTVFSRQEALSLARKVKKEKSAWRVFVASSV